MTDNSKLAVMAINKEAMINTGINIILYKSNSPNLKRVLFKDWL
jgi:hypothetical protein